MFSLVFFQFFSIVSPLCACVGQLLFGQHQVIFVICFPLNKICAKAHFSGWPCTQRRKSRRRVQADGDGCLRRPSPPTAVPPLAEQSQLLWHPLDPSIVLTWGLRCGSISLSVTYASSAVPCFVREFFWFGTVTLLLLFI